MSDDKPSDSILFNCGNKQKKIDKVCKNTVCNAVRWMNEEIASNRKL